MVALVDIVVVPLCVCEEVRLVVAVDVWLVLCVTLGVVDGEAVSVEVWEVVRLVGAVVVALDV